MLANVRQHYVLEVIDPAVVPEEEAKPKRAMICVLITLLSCLCSSLIVLLRHMMKKMTSI